MWLTKRETAEEVLKVDGDTNARLKIYLNKRLFKLSVSFVETGKNQKAEWLLSEYAITRYPYRHYYLTKDNFASRSRKVASALVSNYCKVFVA